MKKIAHSTKKRDVNQLAAAIVEAATTEETPAIGPVKNPEAVRWGQLGGAKGGRARAASLSPRRRSMIARKAAKARWEKRQVKTVSND